VRPAEIRQIISGRLTSEDLTRDRLRILGYDHSATPTRPSACRISTVLSRFHPFVWRLGNNQVTVVSVPRQRRSRKSHRPYTQLQEPEKYAFTNGSDPAGEIGQTFG
jgi:hypothetical protein